MYFRTPFANAGDKTAIPNDTQPDGSMSYTEGFGPDYQLNPASDPSAQEIPRNQTNELNYEITAAIQRLQQFYAPDWIAAADNGGVAFSYNDGAIVLYTDDAYWQSIVNTNTSEPSTDPTKWILFLSNYATGAALAAETARAEAAEAALAVTVTQAAPPGMIGAMPTAATPAGWLSCVGTSYLRATYPALFAVIGTTYGAADGTHFNVPDLRSEFLRGQGPLSAAYGVEQGMSIQPHTHTVGFYTDNTPTTGPGHGGTTLSGTTENTGSTGVVETRPINFSVNWCIKI